jgi:pimeloyl-ACP methyl ester carboxylesterase
VRGAGLPDAGALRPVRVSVGGGVVAGAEAGTGAPILLLHGLGGTWQYWERTLELLAGRARPIALDLPGFGQSDAPPGGYELDSAGDRLAAALRTLGGTPAVIVGHSMGGPLAVRLAVRHPDAVSRLVLVGPSGLAPAPVWQRRALRVLPVYRLLQRAPFAWERWLVRLTPLWRAGLVPLVDNPAAVDPVVARSLVAGARTARELPAGAVASFATGLDEELPHVSAPIAAIWGDRDRMVPLSDAEVLRRAVPSAAVHVLPGCGHMPMIERPEAFAALLGTLALQPG